MLHVVIDTSIYRDDPKGKKGAFRALDRLARGKKIQLHVPYYVKQEFLTQQSSAVVEAINAITAGTHSILRRTEHKKLEKFVEGIDKQAKEILKDVARFASEEFSEWLGKSHAVEHPVKPEHGQRVTDSYFSGAPPFTNIKQRNDIPDSFIWQSILDLSQKHPKVYVIVVDGAFYESVSKNKRMVAFKTLDDFVQSTESQKALKELSSIAAANVERAETILPAHQSHLDDMLEIEIVAALEGKTVEDGRIPDDNNEGTILWVNTPGEFSFDFEKIEYYGENELGIPFNGSIECTLNYAIYKGDYFSLPEEKVKKISMSERNDHYVDADEEYTLEVEGNPLYNS
jgi:PIN domain